MEKFRFFFRKITKLFLCEIYVFYIDFAFFQKKKTFFWKPSFSHFISAKLWEINARIVFSGKLSTKWRLSRSKIRNIRSNYDETNTEYFTKYSETFVLFFCKFYGFYIDFATFVSKTTLKQNAFFTRKLKTWLNAAKSPEINARIVFSGKLASKWRF